MTSDKRNPARLACGNQATTGAFLGTKLADDIGAPITSLASVHRSWGLPSDDEICWLLRQGVDDAAMVSPWPIGATTVRFERGTFDVDEAGERALTFRAIDCGEPVDLVAWQPRTGQVASWRGAAFALGQEAIYNPATCFAGGSLRIHKTPLQWLLADRDGIVIVRPELTYAYLRDVPRISFADNALAQQVDQWLEPPRPRAELFLEVREELAA